MAPSPRGLVAYRRGHGVEADLQTFEAQGPYVGESRSPPGPPVASICSCSGPCRRSRWREPILGGVTEHLPTSAEVPASMVH
jgi:hypothetical protein